MIVGMISFSLMFLDNPKHLPYLELLIIFSDAKTPRHLMAGSVIVTLPILLIFIYFEKYLVGGLTSKYKRIEDFKSILIQ